MKRHVFRNHHHVPYLASAALIGVALGVLMRLFEPMGRFLFPHVFTYQELHPLIAAFIAIAVVIIVRRDCPHRRWRFAMCAAAAAGAYVTMFLFFPFYGSRPLFTGKFALVLLAKTVLPGLIGGLVGYTVWALRDLIFGAPIVQDGAHCGNCGYLIRGLPTSRCPECGMNYRDDGIDPNPPPVLRAWRGVGMWVAVVLFLSGTMYVAFPRLVVYGLVNEAVDSDLAYSYLRLRLSTSAKVIGGYLDHEDARTRASAASTLFRFPGCSSNEIDSLRRLAVSDPDPMVRGAAISTIGIIARDLFESMIADVLTDPASSVRMHALGSLIPYWLTGPLHGGWEIPYLIAALDDADLDCRRHAYILLRLSFTDLPFTPDAPRDERLAQQAVWLERWNEQTAAKVRSVNP